MAFSLVGEKGASDIFKGINSVPNRTTRSASNLMCSSEQEDVQALIPDWEALKSYGRPPETRIFWSNAGFLFCAPVNSTFANSHEMRVCSGFQKSRKNVSSWRLSVKINFCKKKRKGFDDPNLF